jgi:hypothetical protein
MWDYILNKDTEPIWIVNALLNRTAILSTDGLYHRNKASQASRAGWIIACRHTGRMLQGSFYKLSIDASAYRGELLGLVALHTLLHRIVAYYKLCLASGKIVCNSKSALNKSSSKGRGYAQARRKQTYFALYVLSTKEWLEPCWSMNGRKVTRSSGYSGISYH